MQYPKGSGRRNGDVITDELKGLNRQPKGAEGYFSDCIGVASDRYPCISSAAGYETVETGYTNIQAAMAPMYGATKFCGVANGVFYWDGEAKEYAKGIHHTINADSVISYHTLSGYVYIREEKSDGKRVLYEYNTERRSEENVVKIVQQKLPSSNFVFFYTLKGDDNGAYYIEGNDSSLYEATAEFYPLGKDDYNEVIEYTENLRNVSPKTATMAKYSDALAGKTVLTYTDELGMQRKETQYLKKINFLNKNGAVLGDVVIDNIPKIVYIYSHITPTSTPFQVYKNRAWGAKSDGGAIYATSWCSGKDFWTFQSISSDSVEIEVSTQGAFIGFKTYGDSLLCFKCDSITVIYGDTADDFMIGKEIPGVGCIDIRSCQTIDGVLYFLGGDGFYSYSGGWPQFISNNIGTRYRGAIAFAKDGKYFAECEKPDGEKELLVYDTRRNVWLKESVQDIKSVYYKDGETYIVAGDVIKRVRSATEYETQTEEWFIESMDLYENLFEEKGINRILVRAKIAEGAEMTVLTRDENGEYAKHKTFLGSGRIETYSVPVRFKKQGVYRYRIEGKGAAVIYEIIRCLSVGGEEIYKR